MKKEKCCGAVIIKDNKVLLILQNNGTWGFPKGHMEGNETEVETAKREVKEETGLDIEPDLEKRYKMRYIVKDQNIDKTVVFYLAKEINGKIKRQEEEIQEVKWVDFDEALKTITYENTRRLFRKVLKEL